MRNFNLKKLGVLVVIVLSFSTMKAMDDHLDSLKFEVVMSENIFENAIFPQCHASTISETKNGFIAAWFGGTHEKHDDVCIYASVNINGHWSTPQNVADGIENDSTRYPCWNPVLYNSPNGHLMLFYKVGPTVEEWWGVVKESSDNGETWTEGKRLPQAFLGPIKNKPVLINDSILICPSSTESNINNDWKVHFEITEDFGKTWRFVGPINKENKYDIIQPSILLHKDGKLQMLARSKNDFVMSSWSTDNGNNWSEPLPTMLPNPNSGTDAVTLKNGLQLIVFNNSKKLEGKGGGPRTNLSIAASEDGVEWKIVYTLEDESVGEFSYPAIIQGSDGDIHITYTYNRETIKYVRLKVV